MKIFLNFFFLSVLASFISCSDNSTCEQDDWVGEYSLITNKTCDVDQSTTITFNETLIIDAGSNEELIRIDGNNVKFSECQAFGQIPLILNEDIVTVSISTCSADYRKK